MIIKFKIFENVNIDLPEQIGDAIVKIYNVENFLAQNQKKSYWHRESYLFRIDNVYKGEPIIEIEWIKEEKSITIVNYSKGVKTVEKFIELVLNKYSEPMDKYREFWGFRIKLTDLNDIIEELFVDNYETWIDAKKYNL